MRLRMAYHKTIPKPSAIAFINSLPMMDASFISKRKAHFLWTSKTIHLS